MTPGTPMSKQNQKEELNLSAREFSLKSSHRSRKKITDYGTPHSLIYSPFCHHRAHGNLENTFKKFSNPKSLISHFLSIIIQALCQNTNKYCQQDKLFLDFVSSEGDIILKLDRKCVC